jgi:CRP-like cAMP-binding protein
MVSGGPQESSMQSPRPVFPANDLIEALPRRDRVHLLAGCERVPLVFADVIAEPGKRIRQVYFPTTGFVSLLTPGDDCASLGVGRVGREGMVGITLLLGVDVSPLRALVQGTGTALRMDAAPFLREVAGSDALQRELNRYLYLPTVQLAQTAACTHFHLLEERLARWLLMTHDRVHADEFHLTHELIAMMLGVRRVGVTRAAGGLQRRRLIRYHRGSITILDRSGLEAAAYGCYRSSRSLHDRILGEAGTESRAPSSRSTSSLGDEAGPSPRAVGASRGGD